jgi:lipid II:glycine glycyltransferase (peptidoglycan interpeptide bridge formation enzyme)
MQGACVPDHPPLDITTEVDRETWDAFVAAHPAGHLLQTWAWGELKARFGWRAAHVAVMDNSGLQAGAQVLFRALPLGRSLAYIPKGPLVDWTDRSQAGALLAGLHQLCRRKHSPFLKIEPHAPDTLALRQAICAHGFVVSPFTLQPPRTIVVDISPAEDDILAAMKQKTRYNIRLAERKGVIVRPGSVEHVPVFHQLMRITGQRDQFGVHSLDYFRAMLGLFGPDRAVLLLAEVDREPVAAVIVLTHGSTGYYLFGASSDAHREKMPAYLLQWEAIRWAKAHGCESYDLWGIPDADEATLEGEFAARSEAADGLWGVYRFKRGFGGQVTRAAGAFDYVYQRPLYWLYRQWMLRRRPGSGL